MGITWPSSIFHRKFPAESSSASDVCRMIFLVGKVAGQDKEESMQPNVPSLSGRALVDVDGCLTAVDLEDCVQLLDYTLCEAEVGYDIRDRSGVHINFWNLLIFFPLLSIWQMLPVYTRLI